MARNKRTRPKPTFKQIWGRILLNIFVQRIVSFIVKYTVGRFVANRHYDRPGHFRDDGKRVELAGVKHLRILPLIDWYPARSDLETEPGVSYLVEADDTTLLFDLGLNRKREATPPLLRNAKRLGVDLTKIAFVFNSHPHADHLSGFKNVLTKRATLCKENDPLAGKPVYATVRLGPKPFNIVKEPRSLAAGIGTTGPLPRQLLLGYTQEQALVVKVQGKGLVVIIGCGHPGVEALVQRAEEVFQTPVYAVIGGLHYPITDDRLKIGPFKLQQLLGSPNLPWKPLKQADVEQAIAFLKSKKIRFLSVSSHDSCDWSLQAFAEAFPTEYIPLQVGRQIRLTGKTPKTETVTLEDILARI